MQVNKGIVMRIKPNATQRILIEKHLGAKRWLWNYFLERKQQMYQQDKIFTSYVQDAAHLTKLKHDGNHEWLNEISVTSLQRTLRNLETAYKSFFRGRSKFPRFKCKKEDQSFMLGGVIHLKDKKLIVPKFQEGLKFNRDIGVIDKINNVAIRRKPSGKYYAMLSVEVGSIPLEKHGGQIGIDLGLKDFAVLSNGHRIKSPKLFRIKQAALKRSQQHLSRKKLGSNRRKELCKKVAIIHEQIANARKDFLHKTSTFIVRNFDTICIEDLAIKNLVKNHTLAKSINDSGWAIFTDMLKYKTAWCGRSLIEIGTYYPSSKTCSTCASVNKLLKLSDREWECNNCGSVHDRDLNAAQNILAEGKRKIGAGISEYKHGGGVRPNQFTVAAISGEVLNLNLDNSSQEISEFNNNGYKIVKEAE